MNFFRNNYLVLFLSSFFIISGCASDSAAEKGLRSLDSISGALNLKLKELQQIDTVKLHKALSAYNDYRQFITQNVNDTVSKEDGDHLQQFYSAGKKLEAFVENRRSVIARAQLVNSQITKLSADIRNNSVEEEKVVIYISQERSGAEEVMKGTLGQQQQFNEAMEEFRITVTGIEGLIRAHNGGEMPTIIKGNNSF